MKSILCLLLIAGGAAVASAAIDDPRLAEARRLAEAGMASLNSGRVLEAETAFRDAARLLETSPEGADPGELPVVLNNLGAALTLRGESARAIPVLRRALHLADPKHAAAPAIATNLARALIDEGEFAAAAPLVERALDADRRWSSPNRACALGLRAQIDLHEKRPDHALANIEAAMELASREEPVLASRIRWIRAQALRAAGRKAEAAAQVKDLLESRAAAAWSASERKILERFYRTVTAHTNRKHPHI
jgi:tetratricopeptide (TPR) repeat protein